MGKIFFYLFFICCTVGIYSCQKEVSVEVGAVLKSTGSLWDSAGNCLPDSVHGTFYNGITAGSDTAYVDIQVNVTQTGSYKIESDLQDGFLFTDSGFFTNTGLNTIRLKPLGTPIIPTTSVFNISFDSSFCSFTVVINDSTGTGLGGHQDTTIIGGNNGNWQFATDSSLSARGTFYAVQFITDTLNGGTFLQMAGYTQNNDSVLVLGVHFSGNTITPGTYHTQIIGGDLIANAIFAFNLVSTGDPIYEALDNPGDGSDVTITIASYDASTRVVTGTFSGIAIDDPYYPATIGINSGSFTATVSP